MWAASAAVLASAMARSKATRASSVRPSCMQQRALDAEEVEIAGQLAASGSIIVKRRRRALRLATPRPRG